MTRGTVERRWAWTHHPAWYRRATGRDPSADYEARRVKATVDRDGESYQRNGHAHVGSGPGLFAAIAAKGPRVSAVAIVTLALGVGANSAIFSVVNAVLLRPLPFADAERVVNLAWDGGGYLQSLSATKFQYWHDHTRSFDAMATWRSAVARAAIGGEPSTIRALAVSPGFFAAVGNAAARGHGFTPTDFVPGGPSVAMVSHAMWETFAGAQTWPAGPGPRSRGLCAMGGRDPSGWRTRHDRGVLPKSFAFPYEEEPIDVIVPLRMTVDPNDVAEDWPAIARLRDGVTHEQARAETWR